MKKTIFMVLTMISAAACGGRGEKVPAIDTTNFDTSVSPAEDFYMYTTGGWQKKNPLKPEYSRYWYKKTPYLMRFCSLILLFFPVVLICVWNQKK